MASDVFSQYMSERNRAYLWGDTTERTHQLGLKALEENQRILYTAKETTKAFQERQVSSNRT